MEHLSKTDVLILCGGLGTRLGSAVSDRPKPMVEICGKPFLEILIEKMSPQGFQRFILCAGYQGDVIERRFRNYEGLSICISQEPEPLGTAGGLKFSAHLIESNPVLVMNGDSFCPSLNYPALIECHERSGALATVAVIAAAGRQDGGYIRVDDKNRVLSFTEKEYQPNQYLSAGVYVFDRSLLERIPEGVFYSLERDFFPLLGPDFYAYPIAGKVYDIGTPERLEEFRRFAVSS